MVLLAASCAGTPAPVKEQSLTDLVVAGDLNSIKKFYSNQEQLNMRDGEGLYPLHHAVKRGDAQIAEILIVLGASPDKTDPAGKTPLRYAVDRRLVPMAKMLVERGADPFVPDLAGMTPAEAALAAGQEMLDAVFNAKNINGSGKDGRTILHMTADNLLVQEVGLLLDMGASVQAKDRAERSALDLALLFPADRRSALIAEKLILKGANPSFPEFAWFAATVRSPDYGTVRFSNGNTPLHEAISRYQLGFVDFLLSKGLTPNIKNLAGDAPLHVAVKFGWLDGAELLLKGTADPDIRDAKGNVSLHLAAPPTVRLSMTKLLLKYKADASLKDQEGNTALHKAVKLTYEPMIIEELLKAGAPVNAANQAGDTPLMLCTRAGTYQYAQALIAAGADVFLKNLSGESPLSIAITKGVEAVDRIVLPSNVLKTDNLGNSVISTAIASSGKPEVISLILSKGADPNIRNNSQDNALHIAVRKNLEAQALLLIKAKADIFASNSTKETPAFLALAAKDGPYGWFFTPGVIASRDSNGDTVGHLAARKNLAEGLEYLKSKGADLGAVNNARETLLHSAVRTDSAEAARYLVANSASLSARDSNGDSPLHVAVVASSRTCLQVLILSGAEIDARNFTGEAPLHQAVRLQNVEFTTYLVDHGARLEVRDLRGLTPLAVAARGAQTGIAQYLLKSGSFVDARDSAGSTPLYQATETGQLDLIRILVIADADILARNAAGDMPLLASLKKGQAVVREILGQASMKRADSEGKTALRILVDSRASPDILALALKGGADPDARDRYSMTPLHAAMLQKDYQTAIVLLTAHADPFAKTYQGLTPFGMAMSDQASIKDFVTSAGVSVTDTAGESFLHYAVRAGKPEIVKLILDLGTDKNIRNISGETCLDIAKARNDTAAIALLQ